LDNDPRGDLFRPAPPVRSGLFVMVIDADEERCARLLRALSRQGVLARSCHSVESARRMATSVDFPDVIICAYELIGAVAGVLREISPSAMRGCTFCVAITRDEAEALQALDDGADDYLLCRDLEEALEARLQATLRQATVRAWMETLQEASETVSAASRFEGLFSDVAARLRRIVAVDHFVVARAKQPDVRLEVVDMISQGPKPWRFSLTLPVTRTCTQRFQPSEKGFRVCNRVRDDDPRLSTGMQTCLCLQLQGDGRLLGALSLASREPHAFDQTLIPFFRSLSVQVAHAVANIERYELARNEADRLALIVREVHHRIKNNLQGVVGLLARYRDAEPRLALMLNAAISQLHAVAEVHNLLSHHTDERVNLHELIRGISRLDAAMCLHRIEPELAEDTAELSLSAGEAVPFALVLNELILNAIRHGYLPNEHGIIRVCLDLQGDAPRLWVANNGRTPGARDAGTPTGMGLQLVKALLPKRGAFRLFRDGDWTMAEVRLGEWVSATSDS
jgi:two-component sensor histidine kinase/CheY-like chemotaxis protein